MPAAWPRRYSHGMTLNPNDVSADSNKTPGRTHMVTITVQGLVNVDSMTTNIDKDGNPVTYIVIDEKPTR